MCAVKKSKWNHFRIFLCCFFFRSSENSINSSFHAIFFSAEYFVFTCVPNKRPSNTRAERKKESWKTHKYHAIDNKLIQNKPNQTNQCKHNKFCVNVTCASQKWSIEKFTFRYKKKFANARQEGKYYKGKRWFAVLHIRCWFGQSNQSNFANTLLCTEMYSKSDGIH